MKIAKANGVFRALFTFQFFCVHMGPFFLKAKNKENNKKYKKGINQASMARPGVKIFLLKLRAPFSHF